jgi:hypothetical protein
MHKKQLKFNWFNPSFVYKSFFLKIFIILLAFFLKSFQFLYLSSYCPDNNNYIFKIFMRLYSIIINQVDPYKSSFIYTRAHVVVRLLLNKKFIFIYLLVWQAIELDDCDVCLIWIFSFIFNKHTSNNSVRLYLRVISCHKEEKYILSVICSIYIHNTKWRLLAVAWEILLLL